MKLNNLIKKSQMLWLKFSGVKGAKDQQQLIWLICLPCLVITTIALTLSDISSYLIAFIIIILLLLTAYVITASKQRSEHQTRILSNIVESMIEGDFTLRGRFQTDPAFQELLQLINGLAESLFRHKVEAKESRLLLERIMEQMDAMVLAVNEQGIVVMANDSAKKLLLNNVEQIKTIKLVDYELGSIILAAKTGIIDFSQTSLQGEHFLFKETFLSEGQQHRLYLITNAERLLMEKERQAWQSLLRVLSHEVNNSLTPIAAISQAMKQQLTWVNSQVNKESLCEGIGIINERASSLSAFIASYSQLSQLPQPNKTMFELAALLSTTTALFPDTQFVVLNHDESNNNIMIEADRGQLEQVLINIFKNGVEAMIDSPVKTIEVTCKQKSKWLTIIIADHGCGIANAHNIFVPFYSTKPKGSGIGLTLCRQIMFNHGGKIQLINRDNNLGAEAVLSLPN